MPDNEKQATNSHIQRTVDQHLNHLVRHDESADGITSIQRNTDGTYDVRLYDGTGSEARTIESVSKDKLLSMMEDQL